MIKYYILKIDIYIYPTQISRLIDPMKLCYVMRNDRVHFCSPSPTSLKQKIIVMTAVFEHHRLLQVVASTCIGTRRKFSIK